MTYIRDIFRLIDDFTDLETSLFYGNRLNGRYQTEKGSVETYKNGRLHNELGPAVISTSGEEYWIDGRQLTKEQFDSYKQKKEEEKKQVYRLELTKAERDKIESALGRKLLT